jgi:hypothetical protein
VTAVVVVTAVPAVADVTAVVAVIAEVAVTAVPAVGGVTAVVAVNAVSAVTAEVAVTAATPLIPTRPRRSRHTPGRDSPEPQARHNQNFYGQWPAAWPRRPRVSQRRARYPEAAGLMNERMNGCLKPVSRAAPIPRSRRVSPCAEPLVGGTGLGRERYEGRVCRVVPGETAALRLGTGHARRPASDSAPEPTRTSRENRLGRTRDDAVEATAAGRLRRGTDGPCARRPVSLAGTDGP